jgi:hypothetical protein
MHLEEFQKTMDEVPASSPGRLAARNRPWSSEAGGRGLANREINIIVVIVVLIRKPCRSQR